MKTDTRRRIVHAAAKAFSMRGFRGTTTMQIAKMARVNEATLYRQFKRKKTLYVEAARFVLEKDFSIQQQIIGASTKPGDVIRGLIESYRRDPTAVRILYHMALEHKLGPVPISRQAEQFLRFMESMYTRLRDHARLRDVPPLAAAMLMVGTAWYHIFVVDTMNLLPVKKGSKQEDDLLNSYHNILISGLDARRNLP